MRPALTRRLIQQEYLRLKASGEIARVNVVRTVAVRVGYPLDVNRSNEWVRRVLKDFGYLSE
jgi:uncharacterized glyoxalase superfamily metalloenzyme YdcJ